MRKFSCHFCLRARTGDSGSACRITQRLCLHQTQTAGGYPYHRAAGRTDCPAANGAIFQSAQPAYYGYQPLFEDRRPRNVGDILTINLQENVSASKNSSANANRAGKTGFLASILPGFMQGWLGGSNTELDVKGNSDFTGKGGANAQNTFKGTITVTVDQLLANGNLHVVGEKRIAINQGTESIRFSGVVNPRTIGADNSVSSTQVADARIEYVGDGYINESQNMGWLQRFFLNVSPY